MCKLVFNKNRIIMKILVPTDFSVNASKAISVAKNIALATQAKITLLFAYVTVYDFAVNVAVMEEEIEQDAKKKLKSTVKELHEAGIEADIKVFQNSVANATVTTAQDLSYDLIVMGTQGASGIQKALIGSNTASVIKNSDVSVLAIPSKADLERIDHIVFAVGANLKVPVIQAQLFKWIAQLEVTCEILHVRTENDSTDPKDLQDLKLKFQQLYPGFQFNLIERESDEVLEGVNHYLREHPHSLLVMFSKHKSFFESIFSKSHTAQMAYHTHVPLLVIKEKE